VLTHINGEHVAGVPYADVLGRCRTRPLEFRLQHENPEATAAATAAAAPATPGGTNQAAVAAAAAAAAAGGGDGHGGGPGAAAGGEPPPSPAVQQMMREYEFKRTSLVAFYERREPAKLPDVDKLLSGQYDFAEVVKSLKAKYKELPAGWEKYEDPRRAQLADFYARHEPSKVHEVDRLLAHYAHAELLASLLKKVRVVDTVVDTSERASSEPVWRRASCRPHCQPLTGWRALVELTSPRPALPLPLPPRPARLLTASRRSPIIITRSSRRGPSSAVRRRARGMGRRRLAVQEEGVGRDHVHVRGQEVS
jgi:hypothetical protein